MISGASRLMGTSVPLKPPLMRLVMMAPPTLPALREAPTTATVPGYKSVSNIVFQSRNLPPRAHWFRALRTGAFRHQNDHENARALHSLWQRLTVYCGE